MVVTPNWPKLRVCPSLDPTELRTDLAMEFNNSFYVITSTVIVASTVFANKNFIFVFVFLRSFM